MQKVTFYTNFTEVINLKETIQIPEISVPVEVIRSNRKNCGMQVFPDGRVVIRVPAGMITEEIITVLMKNSATLEKHVKRCMQNKLKTQILGKFTREDINRMSEKAHEIIPPRVQYFADKLGVDYGRISIRHQKTRWGSCSKNGNLNFNCLLMEAPPEVIDSVVAHEVCHRKHMNHSKAFYEDLYRIFPEYDKCYEWLKENGAVLIQRMLG